METRKGPGHARRPFRFWAELIPDAAEGPAQIVCFSSGGHRSNFAYEYTRRTAYIATSRWIADCRVRCDLGSKFSSRNQSWPTRLDNDLRNPHCRYLVMGGTFWGYSMPSSICKVDSMPARTRVHTSTQKSLADHTMEIYRRIICELIATFEVDDETIQAGPKNRRSRSRYSQRTGNGQTAVPQIAESRF